MFTVDLPPPLQDHNSVVCLVFDIISLHISQQGKNHKFGSVGMCFGHVHCDLAKFFYFFTSTLKAIYLSLFCHVKGTCK